MRHVRRLSVSTGWQAAVLPLCAALVLSCRGEVGGGSQSTGGGGTSGTASCDPTDPTLVVAEQRIALLTSTQLMNMVRLVLPEADVKSIIDNRVYEVLPDHRVRFPPAREDKKSIPNSTELGFIDTLAEHVGNYVRDNFAAVTKCSTPATDACATTFLNDLAKRAYRRQLSAEEQARFTGSTGLYNSLRSQVVNGYQVSLPVERATGNAVYALFMSPQLLWRWELGGATSTAPAGVYLTDAELASSLSFFLTDQPPDQMLLDAATAGTLRANLASHVDRILMTQASRAWLPKVVRTYFYLNEITSAVVDSTKFPIVASGAIYRDLEKESELFVQDAMWNGKVMDLITSRKAFLNNMLATMVYNVPVPAGATEMNFVETTLPADQRAGLLTNAGFITTKARADGVGVVPRGLAVKAAFLCLQTEPPPASISGEGGPVDEQRKKIEMGLVTAQEQVQSRKDDPVCSSCHATFDAYGLVLDWYDVVGKYRTTDHLNKPIDGTTKLPLLVGGQTVTSAVELADVLSKSDLFVNCMSTSMLQYALIDTAIQLPVEGQKGCAAANVANEVRKTSTQSFTDLTRAIATSPAFVLRKQIP